MKSRPCSSHPKKPVGSNEDPAQPKINMILKERRMVITRVWGKGDWEVIVGISVLKE